MNGDYEKGPDTDDLSAHSPGCQPHSGEPSPEQAVFHYCPPTLLLFGAADHPLALHGLLNDCLLSLHMGQMVEGK